MYSQKKHDVFHRLWIDNKVQFGLKHFSFSETGMSGYNQTVSLDQLIKLSVIGRGASSVVYKCWDYIHNRFVALKCISTFDNEYRKALLKDIAVLSTIRPSKHIINFFNAYFADGQIYLCLQYTKFGTFQRLIESCRYFGFNTSIDCNDYQHLAYVAKIICKVLSDIHQKGIIHRDIKPSNVLIHNNGEIKLTDFGICSLKSDPENTYQKQHSTHRTSSFVGTKMYMSPERLLGQAYSYACDVWSLGVMLMTALFGVHPLFLADSLRLDQTQNHSDSGDNHGEHKHDWQLMHLFVKCDETISKLFFNNDHSFIKNRNTKIDPKCIDFIDKCLDKQEQSRWVANKLRNHKFIVKHCQNYSMQNFQQFLHNFEIYSSDRNEKFEISTIIQSLADMHYKKRVLKRDQVKKTLIKLESQCSMSFQKLLSLFEKFAPEARKWKRSAPSEI